MRSGGIFITATDTGVGKTIVAAAIARCLRDRGLSVGVMKPVTSGGVMAGGAMTSEDAALLAWASDCSSPMKDIAPYVFRAPLAPVEAAALEGVSVECGPVIAAFERIAAAHDYVIVEGAGGLLVPLADELSVAGLVKLLDLPMVVVARPGLGTVNHTLLTCDCARLRGLTVLGTIINGMPESPGAAEEYAPRLIERLSGAPVLGVLPEIRDAGERTVVEILSTMIMNPAMAGVLPER